MIISTATDLVRKDSIEELCGHRARALALYRQAATTLAAAEAAHRLACGGKQYVTTEFMKDMRHAKADGFADEAQRAVDTDMWRFFIVGTPLGSLMDAEEKRRFEDSLRKEVPEVTANTVFATMADLAGNADGIFRRGLVNAFRGFCGGDFRSHDGFKIGRRFVVRILVTGRGSFRYLNHHREDAIRDMDRCFHVLDGKPTPDYQQGILAAIRSAISGYETTATSTYFRVRWFLNGNSHFYPLRPDLVELANKLIAEHYGSAIGASPDARE